MLYQSGVMTPYQIVGLKKISTLVFFDSKILKLNLKVKGQNYLNKKASPQSNFDSKILKLNSKVKGQNYQ